jgi:hypothetical protein
MQLPSLLPLVELEHRLSPEPGGPTRGYIWRTLVAAFWRGDLEAANWTREQLRTVGTCLLRSGGKGLADVAPDEKANDYNGKF